MLRQLLGPPRDSWLGSSLVLARASRVPPSVLLNRQESVVPVVVDLPGTGAEKHCMPSILVDGKFRNSWLDLDAGSLALVP